MESLCRFFPTNTSNIFCICMVFGSNNLKSRTFFTHYMLLSRIWYLKLKHNIFENSMQEVSWILFFPTNFFEFAIKNSDSQKFARDSWSYSEIFWSVGQTFSAKVTVQHYWDYFYNCSSFSGRIYVLSLNLRFIWHRTLTEFCHLSQKVSETIQIRN